MSELRRALTAKDIMKMPVMTFRPGTRIDQAINTLLRRGISGAPVVNDANEVVGVLSEVDCLRVLLSGEFPNDPHEEPGTVRDFMTEVGQTISPDMEICDIAQYFLSRPVRRLPVVNDGKLVGQVSRRDVLRGIQQMGKRRLPRKHYPAYREPG